MKKCVYLLTRIEHIAPDNSEVHTERNLLHATLPEPRVWGLLPDLGENFENFHTKWTRECGWGIFDL